MSDIQITHTCGHVGSYPASPDAAKREATIARLSGKPCNGCKGRDSWKDDIASLDEFLSKLIAGVTFTRREMVTMYRRAERAHSVGEPKHGANPEAKLLWCQGRLETLEQADHDKDFASVAHLYVDDDPDGFRIGVMVGPMDVGDDQHWSPRLAIASGATPPLWYVKERVSSDINILQDKIKRLERELQEYRAKVGADTRPDSRDLDDESVYRLYLTESRQGKYRPWYAMVILKRHIDGSPSWQDGR